MLKKVYPLKLELRVSTYHPDRSINCAGHTAVAGHSAVGGNCGGSGGGSAASGSPTDVK